METEFRALLTGTAAITALVPAASINWIAHPQGRGMPYVVMFVIDNAPGLTMNGTDGLERGRVQVDCYAMTAKGAIDIARAICTRLHGLRSGKFRLIQQDGFRQSREGGSNEAERAFRVSVDFLTAWRA